MSIQLVSVNDMVLSTPFVCYCKDIIRHKQELIDKITKNKIRTVKHIIT